VSTFNNVLVKL